MNNGYVDWVVDYCDLFFTAARYPAEIGCAYLNIHGV